MRKYLFTLLCVLCCLQARPQQLLTLEELTSGSLAAQGMPRIQLLPGTNFYLQANPERTRIDKYDFATGKAVATVFDVTKARDCDLKRFDNFIVAPTGDKILIATEYNPIYRHSYTAVHYLYSLKENNHGVSTENRLERLSDGGPQQTPIFSPNGEMVAFVRNFDIYLVKLLFNNSESRVTDDGAPGRISNGLADWVYEEEFGMTRALTFSADNSSLAYIRFDQSEVPLYRLTFFAGDYPELNGLKDYPGTTEYKYPKAGYPNSKVEVRTFDIKSKVIRTMKLPQTEELYVPRIDFTPSGTTLAIFTINRTQNRMDLFFADAKSTICKQLLREEAPQYVNQFVYTKAHFYDNCFTILSERDGFAQLYQYSNAGNLLRKVTNGSFEVKDVLGYDAGKNTFYITANQEGPQYKAVYAVDEKGRLQKLSKDKGINDAVFSSDMRYYLNRCSNAARPPVVTLHTAAGKQLCTLVDNLSLVNKLRGYALPAKEFFSFTTPDGVQLNGWMMKPPHFDASKKYPVIMYQYSGPGSQEVLDKWGVSWETYMAGQGYVMACVDGRGTGGRGESFEKCTYMNIGVKEAKDQVYAAQYLGTLPFVDATRIGIWGWSYGGYTTLMSMSEGTPVFKAGVAVAAPTDWRYYDNVYTERYMRTPKENAEGYASSSAMARADKLQGKLLLVHGLADDNVHYQNCAEYSERLVQCGKLFSMQLYTNRNHSIYGGRTRLHLYTTITEFFKRNL